MIKTQELNFKKFCMSIGNLPSSYVESLSYYECLLWLCNYLENTVIPAVNNNAEALTELQELFTQLKNYVDNYFDNVDFQELVNNKLDEMVQDGTMAEIINDEIFNNLNTKLNRVTYTKSKLTERIINGTPTKVLFTGDSLTYGQVPSGSAQVDNPFPSLIESFIRTWYNDNSLITCLNYGVRGALATNANNNFNTYLAQNPDTIVWAYGTNDVTQLRSNDTIISDLETFYTSCINNNIELIVIIPGPNFVNEARNQGMRRLHDALLNYCKSRGIIYVDMFEYMNNFYSSLSTTHIDLQTDNTHFIDYTVFRDNFITTLFPIVYKQEDKLINYIEIDNTPKYVVTNQSAGGVSGGINPFYRGIVIRTDTDVTFKLNILVTKPSYLILNGYTNVQGGTGTFTIDSVDYNVNENSTGTGTTSLNNIYNYKFPVLLNVGLHTINLKSITFADENQIRFFLFGFTLLESDDTITHSGYIKAEEDYLAWSGNETSLTDQLLSLPLNKNNNIKILLGIASSSYEYVDVYPNTLTRNFFEDSTFKIPVAYGSSTGILTISIDYSENTISISSTINIPIRKIYLLKI